MRAGAPRWRGEASLDTLRLRARLLAAAREFFADRGVLEIQTPAAVAHASADRHVTSVPVRFPHDAPGGRFLRTSPEHAMKRLLAAGSGDIYEVANVFRADEPGRLHSPEFTLVEWYRVGLDHLALMDEVHALLVRLLGPLRCVRLSYREAMLEHAGIDPFEASRRELEAAAAAAGLAHVSDLDADGLLDFLMGAVVQPSMPAGLTHVFDYPKSQAALACVRPGESGRAERFETFVNGVELANGYHELVDAAALARRCAGRLDPRLHAALEHGLPACAGVALGFDRVVMLAGRLERLGETVALSWEGA